MPDIDIFINNQKIARVNQTKFLGVIVQHNLKWHSHIHLIQSKISKTIGVMNKVKNLLSTSHLHLLYQSLVEPYLNYGCIIWANPEKNTILDVLFKLQKRAARVIVHANYRAHTRPIFINCVFLIFMICVLLLYFILSISPSTSCFLLVIIITLHHLG